MSKQSIASMILAAVAVVSTGLVVAGPLDPPAGPVAPTYKTLTEVEPRIAISTANTPGDGDSLFRITHRGSYYLTDNVMGAAAKHGIEIAASGVTIDLNGFDMVGVAGSLDGIRTAFADLREITIRNGSLRNWGGDGIDLTDLDAHGCRVEGVHASINGGSGILVFSGAVESCTADSNNGAYGIYMGYGAIRGCTVIENAQTGLIVGEGGSAHNCTARGNGFVGIHALLGSTVSNCSARLNGSTGINAASGSNLRDCTSSGNEGSGLSLGWGASATGCTIWNNAQHGIVATNEATIVGNSCTANGSTAFGAGIRIDGNDCRVEDNLCAEADMGVQVLGAGNFIARNRCASNSTNWSIGAGNICLVVSAATNAAFAGNAGGVAPGSADPSANFSF